jgi:hypothetical protein
LSEAERARRAREAAEKAGAVDDLGSDSEDSVVDLTAQPAAKKKRRVDGADRAAHLATLRTDADRLLQRVLWHCGFGFSLKTHQPEAARLCAGLPRGWPRDDLGGDLGAVLRAAPPFVGRGVLLADVMGLGKTVECLAGAVLRDAIARAKGDDDLPTFVVAPNDAVLAQWREHLVRGVVAAASKVHIYKGAFKSRVARYESAVARGATFVLLTRYTLQTEVQGAYDAALDGASLASPLFPRAAALLPDLFAQYRSAAGKAKRGEKNTLLRKGETEADCVRRLVAGFFFGGGRSSAVVKAEAVKAEGAARRRRSSSTRRTSSGTRRRSGASAPRCWATVRSSASRRRARPTTTGPRTWPRSCRSSTRARTRRRRRGGSTPARPTSRRRRPPRSRRPSRRGARAASCAATRASSRSSCPRASCGRCP